MTKVGNVWKALYFVDGKAARHSLKVSSEKEAIKARDAFFTSLLKEGATVYTGRSVKDKLKDKPNLYVYERPPYQFRIGAKVLFESWDKDEVVKARDKHFAKSRI